MDLNKTKCVLIINLEGKIAGAEQSLLLMAEGLIKHKNDVKIAVACPAPSPLSVKLDNLKIPIFRLCPTPSKSNLKLIWILYLLRVNFQILGLVLKIRPKIIHANGSKAVLASAIAHIWARTKLIWHIRDKPKGKFCMAVCNYLSDKIVVVSSHIKERLQDSVKTGKSEVIFNGISIDKKNCDRKVNCGGRFIFANIGQFVPWKKQLLFIEAAEEFLRRNKNSEFWIIGDDIFGRDSKYKDTLLQKVLNSRFRENIKVVPWQDDLIFLWEKICVLVHTADSEPFGRVIIEAMGNKIPVIAADGGGPSEIIEHNKTGLLYEPGNANKLISMMEMLVRNPELTNRLANNAYESVCVNFNSESCTEKILNLYKELLAA